MIKLISLFFTFLFLLFGLMLGVMNPHLIKLDLFIFQMDFPLGLSLAIMLVVGMLLGAVLIKIQVTQLAWRLKKQNRLNQKQANELVHLKKELAQAKQLKSKSHKTAVAKEIMPIQVN